MKPKSQVAAKIKSHRTLSSGTGFFLVTSSTATGIPMLARLALRVLALPSVETSLTLNCNSQLVSRLRHLGQRGSNSWNWKLSLAGFGSAGLLFLIVAGFHYSEFGPVEFKGKKSSGWYQKWDLDLAARESGFSPNFSLSVLSEYQEKIKKG